LFAAAQTGEIWTFENKADVTESHLFLDLQAKVQNFASRGANEEGLLGLAMHPGYKDNGKFYVYYTDAEKTRSILSEFTVSDDDPNAADPASEKVIMTIDQPFKNHNGGAIEFGPDGYLYIGLGDGGFRNDPESNGQNLSTLLGSILRIDVDSPTAAQAYGIPKDNPFVGQDNVRPEIFAYGIRNPWRMAFDKKTGKLWVGDVGQELWEEVNVITKGGNYGWSTREGTNSFSNGTAPEGASDPIDPVWQYDHRIGRSITGGRVYRSSRVPELNGAYLYADYVSGVVWALMVDEATGNAVKNVQVLPKGVSVLAFGEDQSGEVFYLVESPAGKCIYRIAE
jgi:glucose/arabinose dehydrogenase